MTERIYMVEQAESRSARILSCWATYALAAREVARLLDKMPKGRSGSWGRWEERPKQKRGSYNHGKTEMVWGCSSFGPSTRHISAYAVVSLPVRQGSAVDRLAVLAKTGVSDDSTSKEKHDG